MAFHGSGDVLKETSVGATIFRSGGTGWIRITIAGSFRCAHN